MTEKAKFSYKVSVFLSDFNENLQLFRNLIANIKYEILRGK
jgi:hypothetical protein